MLEGTEMSRVPTSQWVPCPLSRTPVLLTEQHSLLALPCLQTQGSGLSAVLPELW